MKSEIWLFLKRSFPVSFEVVVAPQIEVQNENVAFAPNPIPPPLSQKSIFRTGKTKIASGIRPTSIIKWMISKPVKFETNPTKIQNTSLKKKIFQKILGMKMLTAFSKRFLEFHQQYTCKNNAYLHVLNSFSPDRADDDASSARSGLHLLFYEHFGQKHCIYTV